MATTGHRELVLDAEQVAERVAGQGTTEDPGVRRTVLWQQDGSTAGILELEAGARMGEHVHEHHSHHVWMLTGRAEVLGRTLEAESYWFVPPGRPHTLDALDPAGCRLFYLYLRTDQ